MLNSSSLGNALGNIFPYLSSYVGDYFVILSAKELKTKNTYSRTDTEVPKIRAPNGLPSSSFRIFFQVNKLAAAAPPTCLSFFSREQWPGLLGREF